MSNTDWNTLIQHYTAEGRQDIVDRRYELWICGYVPQGQMLADMVRQRPARVLDFGCGNGRVSRFLGRQYGYEVVGVDINQESIRRARSFSDGMDYHLIAPDLIPADLSKFDACVCNQVFPTYSSLDKIRHTLTAIRGALKPGAPVLIYGDNTKYTGIRYYSFMAGVPGAHYRSGDPLPMEIYLDGEVVMNFEDTYWSPDDILRTLAEAGFTGTAVRYSGPEPAARAIYESYFNAPVAAPLAAEAESPPAAIYTGIA